MDQMQNTDAQASHRTTAVHRTTYQEWTEVGQSDTHLRQKIFKRVGQCWPVSATACWKCTNQHRSN